MFSSQIKAACRFPARRAKSLCLLSFILLTPLMTSAVPVLSLDGSGRLVVPSSQNSSAGDGKKEFGFLKAGEVVRREMVRGETHVFKLAVEAGQYVRVVVEQEGVDLTVKIMGPDGGLIADVDSPNGLLGPEAASVIAEKAGDYSLEIGSKKGGTDGSYEVKIEALREPTRMDNERVRAERLFAEGQSERFKETKESRELAIEKYKEARAIWATLGDAQAESYALCNIGRMYKALGLVKDALDYLNRALVSLQNTKDEAERAFILNEIGATQRDLGDPLEALGPYNRALQLRISIGDQWGQAQALNNIGLIHWHTGYYRKAVESYEEAIRLWQAAHDRYWEANTRNNLGEVYVELSQSAEAMEDFKQALEVSREFGNRRLEAYARNNIGKVYESWGDPQTALRYYEDALNLFQDQKYQSGEALVLSNIGMAHADAGDTELGLESLRKSLEIFQRLKEPGGISISLTNIGYTYALQNDHAEALKYFNQALQFTSQTNNKLFLAYAQLSAGMAYAASGEPNKALEHYQLALDKQREMDDRRGEAITVDRMGQVYASLGDASKAFVNYEQALDLWVALNDKQGEALTLYHIARSELDRNNLKASLVKIEKAISIVESLRTKMTSQRLQLIYFETKQDYYALSIEARLRLYDITHAEEDKIAALNVNELARARNFLDLLTEARADMRRGVPPELAEKYNQLGRDINAQAEGLMRLRNNKLNEKAAVEEKRLDELYNQYVSLQVKISDSRKPVDGRRGTQPQQLKQIQQLLDDDTILLEYALGDKRSYLWAVKRNSVDLYYLPARARIESAANAVKDLLTIYEQRKPNESNDDFSARTSKAFDPYWKEADKLSQVLLGQVSVGKASRFVIVADGILQYLPFEALPIPGSTGHHRATSTRHAASHAAAEPVPLISRFEVVYEPSASVLAQLRAAPRKQPAKTLAVLADPIFGNDDERVSAAKKNQKPDAEKPVRSSELSRALRDVGDTGTQGSLPRLKYTEGEADSIIKTAGPNNSLKAVGFQANRALAMSAEMKQYAIIHIATHGLLDTKHPDLSGLVLSLVNERGEAEDGFLRLHDIYNLDLSANLVVLSACRTGIGNPVRGEGLIGLTRGFMYAGAGRVLASLWKVEDEATAALMNRFYVHLLKEHKTAATSLRLAQLEIMNDRDQWRAPYYWSGFVLQGDWK